MAFGDSHVFHGFLTPVLTQLSASAEVRGENTPERKFTSTVSRTHSHQVMGPTRSLLSHPGGANGNGEPIRRRRCLDKNIVTSHCHYFSKFLNSFSYAVIKGLHICRNATKRRCIIQGMSRNVMKCNRM